VLGLPNSRNVNRYWFRSLYFCEPNGILFEIATDRPDLAEDEDPAAIGEKLVLTPFPVALREHIVENLKCLD
jgi:glyoxalase family protein